MSWYRTYRPQQVKDLHITPVREAFMRILQQGEFAHAYLLAGPKGTGKTSAARILAKVLNCEQNRSRIENRLKITTAKAGREDHREKTDRKSIVSGLSSLVSLSEPCNTCAACIAITSGSSLSVTEMDAASNRGIDDIRELRDRIGLVAPDGIISVFIIDEVHMLTSEAFNALLKVLEEPPAHVVFVLATTDPQKLPATIISRCTLIRYRKANQDELMTRLEQIAQAEGIKATPEILKLIATAADGSLRDCVKLFEHIASGKSNLTEADVLAVLGTNTSRLAATLLTALLQKDAAAVAAPFAQIQELGMDGVGFQKEVLTLAHTKLVEFAASGDARYRNVTTLLQAIAVPVEPQLSIPWLPFELACFAYVASSGAPAPTVTPPAAPVQSDPVSVQPLTDADSERLRANWSLLLQQIKTKSNPVEGLLKSTRLLGITDGRVHIEAGYQFHKDQLELDRNAKVIEAVFAQFFGKSVRFQVTLGKVALKTIRSKDNNVSGKVEDEGLVQAAHDAFL